MKSSQEEPAEVSGPVLAVSALLLYGTDHLHVDGECVKNRFGPRCTPDPKDEDTVYAAILAVVDGNAQTNERIAEVATQAVAQTVAEVRRAAGEQIAQAIEREAVLRERGPDNDWERGTQFGLSTATHIARKVTR